MSSGHPTPTDEPSDPSSLSVIHEPGASRYEAHLDGRRVGVATYRSAPGSVAFLHTEVDPDLAGRGVGSRLTRSALDDVVASGLRITPLCPFVAAYIDRHPEYVEHVDEAHRAQFTHG